jgi:hypothetical protein
MSISRPGRSWSLGGVRIHPVERNGRGVLMQPGRRDGLDLQGSQGDRAKPPIEIGGQQGIEDVPQPRIIECGPREPWLQQRYHPSLFQPSPHLLEGMMPIQNGEHPGFDSTPTREPMRRMGRDEVSDKRGDLQAP